LPSGELLTLSQQNRLGAGEVEAGQAVTVGWKHSDAVIVGHERTP
jgi:hypothetical protein